jgi:hypothetical protein
LRPLSIGLSLVSKLIMTPQGVATPKAKPRRDETLVKALLRAHRWRRRIESGEAKSITGLTEQEGVTDAYVCRVLPLTCLAPDIVEAILDGRQPRELKLAAILGNGPMVWEEQRARSGFERAPTRRIRSHPGWIRTHDCRSRVVGVGFLSKRQWLVAGSCAHIGCACGHSAIGLAHLSGGQRVPPRRALCSDGGGGPT